MELIKCTLSVQVPPEARCTFESGFCGWQNTSEEMMLTWKLNKGDRQKFTGPKWDNTFQNRSGKSKQCFGLNKRTILNEQ